MKLTLLHEAFTLHNNILLYAQSNFIRKESLSDTCSSSNNFIYDDCYRYYLSDDSLKHIYTMILEFKQNHKLKNFDPSKDFQGNLVNLFKNVYRSLKRILRIRIKRKRGRNTNTGIYLPLLQKMLILNPEANAKILINILQGKISAFFASEREDDYLKFNCSETSMCLHLGHNLLRAYFIQLTPFYNILHQKEFDIIKLDKYDNICKILLNIYHKQMAYNNKSVSTNNLVLSPQDLNTIRSLLAGFGDDIIDIYNDDKVLELFCHRLLLDIIQKLLRKDITLNLISLEAYMEQNHISNSMLQTLSIKIKEASVEAEYLLGSIVVNHLIENNVFTLTKKVVLDNKVSYYLELTEKLTYGLMQNGADVKPFLSLENRHHFTNTSITTEENIVLEFERENLLNPLRNNNTGYAYFTPNSPFAQDPSIADIYATIDKEFLNNFITHLTKYSGRTYETFNDEEKRNNLYSFLFFYRIDFEALFKNTSESNHLYVQKLIDFALDFSNTKFDNFHEDFKKNIPDIHVRRQLLVYLNQINSYQAVLKAALIDYVIYSCFGYFIMPSFFDFRGRRYFHGISFNIQSYPFLKAFIKLYDLADQQLSDDHFNKIVNSTIAIINDPDIKEEIKKQFGNCSEYNSRILEHVKDYFYDQINPNKLSREDFNQFFDNPPIIYEDLYNKILDVIKKKSKTLVFVSFFMLERRKKTSIIWYSNSYSYDMTTSGYQMLAIAFASKKLGSYSNIIVEEDYEETYKDLYLMVGLDYKKTISITNKCFNAFLSNIPEDSLIKKFKEFFLEFSQNTLAVNEKLICERFLLDPILLDILHKSYNKLLETSWVLFPVDKQTIKNLRYTGTTLTYLKAFKALLILARINNHNSILQKNPWIEENDLLYSRTSRKGMVMISIYGGKERGRRKSFIKYIKEILVEKGIGLSKNTKALFALFPYINNHFLLFKSKHLEECDLISKVGRYLTTVTNEIVIQSEYFTCCLCPQKAAESRRLRQNLQEIDLSRKNYQQSLYRSQIQGYGNTYHVVIDKGKQISLFPPDYTHFLDGYGVQIFLHMISQLNTGLNSISPLFKITPATIHDNFSLGRFFFPILPYLLLDIYRRIYTASPLSFLESNFSSKEAYTQFRKKFTFPHSKTFSKEFLTNSNMLKFG